MGRGRRIDVQHHFLPQEYVDAVGADQIAGSLVSARCPDWTPQVSLDAMDRNGIDLAMLSIAAPGFHFDRADAAASLARRCNEIAADHVRAHPGRFGFFATLPLPHVDESLEAIEYAFDKLGADGVGLLTNYDGIYLGDPRLDPVLEELDRRGAVAFVHPADMKHRRPLGFVPPATLEYPFDTTRAITSLLFSGVMARLRQVRFIFSHAGGTLPFLADRIVRLERRADLTEKVPNGALAEMKRHYYDIALSASPRTLGPLLAFVPPEQILFASDFPFAGEDTMAATVRRLNEQGLPERTVQTIERGAAEALFGLASPARSVASSR